MALSLSRWTKQEGSLCRDPSQPLGGLFALYPVGISCRLSINETPKKSSHSFEIRPVDFKPAQRLGHGGAGPFGRDFVASHGAFHDDGWRCLAWSEELDLVVVGCVSRV